MGEVIVLKDWIQEKVDELERDVRMYCDEGTFRRFRAIDTIKLFNKRAYMIEEFRNEFVKPFMPKNK